MFAPGAFLPCRRTQRRSQNKGSVTTLQCSHEILRGSRAASTSASKIEAAKCMPKDPQQLEEQQPLAEEDRAARNSAESESMRSSALAPERAPLKAGAPGGRAPRPPPEGGSPGLLAFCFFGLQISYLTWGYVQEKVMTTEYGTSGRFPSATFCVFSNRVLAIVVAFCCMVYKHRSAVVPAPLWVFAPCSVSNSLSSYGQYQSLRYVSFPLQTLSKSTKVIPVMIMGKVLNNKSYPWLDYAEALAISLGVSMFSFSESHGKKHSHETQLVGVALLGLYIVADSFTSQWQSRVYKAHPGVDQFQMMFAVNVWSALFTLAALIMSSELFISLDFIAQSTRATSLASTALCTPPIPFALYGARLHALARVHAASPAAARSPPPPSAHPRAARRPRRSLGQRPHFDHVSHWPAFHLLHHPQVRACRVHDYHDDEADVLHGLVHGQLWPHAGSSGGGGRAGGLRRTLLSHQTRWRRRWLSRFEAVALVHPPQTTWAGV